MLIDTALGQGCKDFDSFLAAMKGLSAEVKQGKHLAFKIPNGKRFVRCDSLGADYSEAAIMERISGKRIVAPKAKAAMQCLLKNNFLFRKSVVYWVRRAPFYGKKVILL